ncbi:hypothetical protein H4R33_001470 [Dimargaris cristalligena]|nr:hypothetical protein H4R33_001470 [Dimargaris cristalligena]
MCGILFGASPASFQAPEKAQWEGLKTALNRRGPDAQKEVCLTEPAQLSDLAEPQLSLYGYATVLHLRGEQTVAQPLQDPNNNYIFFWNGEVFDSLQKFSESLTCYRWSSLPATPTSLSGISGIEAVPQLQLPYQSVNKEEPLSTQLVGAPASQSAPDSGSSQSNSCPSLDELVYPLDMQQYAQAFIGVLRQALRERVETIPSTLSLLGPDSTRVAVLFSGGVDCLCLAALLHQILPPGEPIDLINVAFENPRTTQLPASSQGPKHRGSFYHGPPYQMTLPSGEVYLFDEKEYHRLFDVPDRLTGRASFRALAEWAPQRTWRFVAVNVPYSQVEVQRTRITQLMQPAHTVMDWSIALALWFAATGEGYLEPWQTEHEVPISPTIQLQAYRSPAPVLLLGMGADEQLGGYSKHRDRFEAQGWVGLVEEMQGQIDRIAIRNLGRDDRIISDHGKESRFPFLSHRVVDFLCSVPVHYKADLRFQRGIGEKILLRYALRQLGLPLSACQQWKKAIQFGARTAKMTSGKDKGTDKI